MVNACAVHTVFSIVTVEDQIAIFIIRKIVGIIAIDPINSGASIERNFFEKIKELLEKGTGEINFFTVNQ